MSDSPAQILYDENGNAVAVIQDGSTFRLATTTAVTNSVLPDGAASDTTLSGVLTTSSYESRTPSLGLDIAANSRPVVFATDADPVDVNITSASGIDIGVQDSILIPDFTPGILIMGEDSEQYSRRLLVTNDGRLVINAAVSAPPNRDAVSQGAFGNVTTVDDGYYTIPSGEEMFIQRFASGSEETNGGSSGELYYAPNGNDTNLVLIRVIYSNGNSTENALDFRVPDLGDGTRAILCRRRRLSGGAVEIAAFWDGYY